MSSVRYNIQVTKQKIRAEMHKSALGHLSIPKLVAVSKQQPDNKVDQSILAGHRVFGENRVQEAKQRGKQEKSSILIWNFTLLGLCRQQSG